MKYDNRPALNYNNHRKMKAQVLNKIAPVEENPLELVDLPVPEPAPGQILIKVSVCGICHTEIDEIEGRRQPKMPVIPGHEVVGRVEAHGSRAANFRVGDRVGIAWINSACGKCQFCRSGRENLCPEFQGTGCDADGGYAEYTVVSEKFAYLIPKRFTDSQAAPLLCAGAIGYRALNLTGIKKGQTLGLFGFGASAHIVMQLARYLGYKTYVLTREEDKQEMARTMGAAWAGGLDDQPPEKLDCAIEFTPVGETVARAMAVIEKGGRLVINAIRKRTTIELDYTRHVWYEKEIKSVANITRKDVSDFLALAAQIPIIPKVQEFKLEDANRALNLLKQGKILGAGVLRVG